MHWVLDIELLPWASDMHMPVRARADAATMAQLLGAVTLTRVLVVGPCTPNMQHQLRRKHKDVYSNRKYTDELPHEKQSQADRLAEAQEHAMLTRKAWTFGNASRT